MSPSFKIAVIGSGPSGLSAAGHAAELGIAHVLLEASPHPADTIYKYQKGKHVMAEPGVLPLRSPMSFSAGTREAVLGAWDQELEALKVNIRFGAEVVGISGQKGDFQVKLGSGETIGAETVVLAIGLQGNLRKVGVKGDDHARVQYQLDDPDAFEDETILVVGAGDAAIENALALAKQNRVILINRNDEFARCKEGNLNLILAAIEDGRVECRYGTRAEAIEALANLGDNGKPLRFRVMMRSRATASLPVWAPRRLARSSRDLASSSRTRIPLRCRSSPNITNRTCPGSISWGRSVAIRSSSRR
jgi:thioredoxin reductase